MEKQSFFYLSLEISHRLYAKEIMFFNLIFNMIFNCPFILKNK